MKRELARAIRAEGSVKALAQKLGVSPSTINRWRKSGVPKKGPGRQRFSAYRIRKQREAEFREIEQKTFRELLAEATQRRRMPTRARSGRGRREGPGTTGMRYTLALESVIDKKLIAKVAKWLRSLPTGDYPLWQAQLVSTQYTLPQLGFHAGRGYNTIGDIQQMSHPSSGDFSIGEMFITPVMRTRKAAGDALLTELVSIEGNFELFALVHQVTLFNYYKRTEAERRQWETQQRRKRERQWERKQRLKKQSSNKQKKAPKKSGKNNKKRRSRR